MNLSIDLGNSSTKIGIFDKNELIKSSSYNVFNEADISRLLQEFPIEACIFSSVRANENKLINYLKQNTQKLIELTHETAIPIKNEYATPETLGKDRLAAVVGAAFLKPDTDLFVIDAGTAITYDFIDASGIYKGGNIAPGIELRLRALHEFTQKLPLVKAETKSPLLGTDTNSAILSGVLHGIVFEIDGYINVLKQKYPQLSTFLTGGSTFYFDTKLKSAIFAEKNLVLIGLNRILQYNV